MFVDAREWMGAHVYACVRELSIIQWRKYVIRDCVGVV